VLNSPTSSTSRTGPRGYPTRQTSNWYRKASISASASRRRRCATCIQSNSYDLAVIGRGFFQIETADGGTVYSRDGAFNTNENGEVVTINGARVIPNITVPVDATEVSINRSGQVFVRIGKETDLTQVGQLQLANFVNEAGLKELGDNLFQETPASGAPVIGAPDDPAYGYIQQGYLEGSNVDPVKEITELISAQRAYEMNSKVITTADEMAATVSKNMR
jgi:flagellar basal-body rod protein FlgG